ncbi:hypothetical protein MELA_01755 [Candidatus Methylomirabilis lanthanidiphila]|uniref:DUF3300 domain-containing protein n=1 Tax=Candidatus Methylomirabilis lanthanidiphila TaxID=2211376 RepID=A0A564ZJ47_9BACT|nr:DUF3300 domain-containing protein [Candidatus Methylomirabilis lanthanidiphila]VUZ85371.1 hypothetical protein MELA_01755 [Candidatus Methylomirabilis lanthanidiphila]
MIINSAAGRGLLGMLILLLAAPPSAVAQPAPLSSPPPAETPAPPIFQQEELDQLLAPIALYPDALLAQILMASTYPLEVVQAARWVKAYPNVVGPQLEEVMQQQPWDPSVKSLAAFPQVLAMMDANLEWTQKLGEAFLAQQPDVMVTVQTLRIKAQAAGYLQTTPQQTIIAEPQVIRIEPATPRVVYVPIYDPTVVYGPWWYPAYPPYVWYPPGYVVGAGVFSFGVGLAAGAVLWGGFDWHRHHVTIVNVHNYNTFNRTRIMDHTWRHDASHRRGVPYRDPGVRQRFGQGLLPGAPAREAFRGRPQGVSPLGARTVDRRPVGAADARVGGGQQGGHVAPQVSRAPRPPAALEGLGRGGETRNSSDRGRTSRLGTGAARPAPSVPRAPAGGGRIGGGGGGRR